MPAPYCVLGSGPTGVASARALLDRGCEVLLIDAGAELEPDRRARLTSLKSVDPAVVRERMGDLAPVALPSERGGFPLKLAFGSRFPYAFEEMSRLEQEGTRCVESHARGGLSNVWGAAILPFRESDVRGWPVSHEEMARHYAAVAAWMPICGGRDDLESEFPYHGAVPGSLALSRQARMLQQWMLRHRAELHDRGYRFGQARLAVRGESAADGCQSVGLCLTGCPFGAIFNAADVLDEMRALPRFRYLSGFKVERLVEDGELVSILGRRADGGTSEKFEARRVLVALGVISTTKLVLRSLRETHTALELRYHPYFLMPLLLLGNTSDVGTERLHALAQLFVEVDDPGVSSELVHLQLYTFSPQLEAQMRGVLHILGPLGAALTSRVVGRLAVIQGYFHASEATPILVRALRDRHAQGIALRLTAGDTRPIERKVARLAWKLRRDARFTGFFPIPLATRFGRPGDGNHVGAIFPMRHKPGALEVDTLGRLQGQGRIHLVDASVLPSLPATTITYTAMANAHRIATKLAATDAAEAG